MDNQIKSLRQILASIVELHQNKLSKTAALLEARVQRAYPDAGLVTQYYEDGGHAVKVVALWNYNQTEKIASSE